MGGYTYTPEQLDWIKDNYSVYKTRQSLTDAFNAHFNDNRSSTAIGLAAVNRCGLRRNKRQLFTPEEDAWLADNYSLFRSDILRDLFVEKFDHDISPRGLITHCNAILNIVSGRQNYKKGRIADNILPIGTERVNKQGYTLVKVNAIKGEHGNNQTYHDNWKFKQILVWEQHHGPVPPGHNVIFLDGDKNNFGISNLCCIPTKYMGVLAANKWYTGDPNITDTAVKWCYFNDVISDILKEK
jgi:hypothetical protein